MSNSQARNYYGFARETGLITSFATESGWRRTMENSPVRRLCFLKLFEMLRTRQSNHSESTQARGEHANFIKEVQRSFQHRPSELWGRHATSKRPCLLYGQSFPLNFRRSISSFYNYSAVWSYWNVLFLSFRVNNLLAAVYFAQMSCHLLNFSHISQGGKKKEKLFLSCNRTSEREREPNEYLIARDG